MILIELMAPDRERGVQRGLEMSQYVSAHEFSPAPCPGYEPLPNASVYRGTSLIGKRTPLGPYSWAIPRAQWWT